MSGDVTFQVSGTTMTQIEGSELYQRPEKYDDSDAVREASKALHNAMSRRTGKGWTHKVTCSRQAAEEILTYCEDVGFAFAGQMDTEVRADGRALLKSAERIRQVLTERMTTQAD